MPLDYENVEKTLRSAFAVAESAVLAGEPVATVPVDTAACIDRLFSSKTQSYREVLLGCILAKLDDPALDVRKAYINLGDGAFNGRTLDERVVNPFLQEFRIPCSKGPYLAVFRRSVPFSQSTRQGTKDKEGFDAFLELVERVQHSTPDANRSQLRILLHRFAALRESSAVPISKLNRASLTQYDQIVDSLLRLPSGGRMPVVLIVSVLKGIKTHFGLGWEIQSQGINEADAAKGAGADISVYSSGNLVLSAEVTERTVDKARIISTFNTKISPAALEDYLFFVNEPGATDDARVQAGRYFAQGSEVNFVDIRTWARMSLVTMGKGGRAAFNASLTDLLAADDMPRSIKLGWNEIIARVTSG
jgi:hypothetical protein